jgi:hypothetical protein
MPIKKGKSGYTVKYAGSKPVKVNTLTKAKRVQKKQKKG